MTSPMRSQTGEAVGHATADTAAALERGGSRTSVIWNPPDFMRLLSALGSRWKTLVTVPVLAVLAAAVYLIASNPTYTVGAQLMLRPGAELAMPATVSVQTNQPNSGGFTRLEDVTAEVQIMKDPALVATATAALGEDFFFGEAPPQTLFQTLKSYAKGAVSDLKAAARGALVSIGLLPELSRMDLVELMLQKSLTINHVTRSDMIEVSLAYPDPVAGEKVLQTFLDAYLARRNEIYADRRVPEYFAAELAVIEGRLVETEDQYRNTRASLKAWSIEEQRDIGVGRREKLIENISSAGTEIAETEARLAGIDAVLKGLPERIESSVAETVNPVVSDLHLQKIKLALDLEVERRLRGEASPQALVLAKQLTELEKFIGAEPQRMAGDLITIANPQREKLLADKTEGELKVATLRKRAETMSVELAALEARLHEVDSAAVDLSRMERTLAQLRDSQQRFARGQEEAQIAANLRDARISNLIVVAQPKAGVAPDKPRVSRVLLIVLMGAMIASAGWILVEDALHPSVRSNADIHKLTGDGVIIRAADEQKGLGA